jgi:hypothetical protein
MAELEKTDLVLERAQQAVGESGSQKGESLLDNARRLQQYARDRYHQHQYGQATETTLKARDKALEAIAATRTTEENENAVRRQLERTDQLLQAAQERLAEVTRGRGTGPAARLDFLLDRQQTAWQQFHERRLRPALKITLQVREQISRAAEQARRYRHGPANTGQDLDRLREYIDRVREPLTASGSARSTEMLDRAERRLAQADEAFSKGQMSVASEHAQICRELLDRAMAGIDQTLDAPEVAELIARAQAEWNRLEGAVIDAGDKDLRELHQRAGAELRRAEAVSAAGDMAKALAHARTATKLLNDIEERLP